MTYHIGVKYDEWGPNVEADLFNKLVTLQNKTKDVVVICDNDKCDKLLKSLGISRLSINSMASLWILYYVKKKFRAPDSAKEVIEKSFIVEKKGQKLDLGKRNPYPLKEFGRDSVWNPMNIAPPANQPGLPYDPRVPLLFG